ncbi:MAG: VWA domain-containing protein [Pseudomonadota bacterium]
MGDEEELIPHQPVGRLTENILHFARALRKAGMPVGSGRVIDAVHAVEAAGFSRRRDFYWTLHACFVSRAEHRALFDATFKLFWRDPQLMEKMMSVLMREADVPPEDREKKAAETRAQEALAGDQPPPSLEEEGEEIEFDATFTVSDEERLQAMDFEQMSTREIAAAKQAIARLSLPVEPIVSRRLRPASSGSVPDWRATLKASIRSGGAPSPLQMRERRTRWPNLVAICDISGSMSGYSRMLLHFLHAVSNRKGAGWAKVHSFVFGTRLTNVTRHLATRDVDEALAAAGAEVEDWEGGTRIGACLHAFNRDWSRRVLGQGAVVLLITDGLDRDDASALEKEAERLRLSSRQLIWLNPLLRWDGFAPKAQGVRALLPRVDSFRAAHNIHSLAELADALGRPDDVGERVRLMRMLRDERDVRSIDA